MFPTVAQLFLTVHFEVLNVIIRQTLKSNARKMRYISTTKSPQTATGGNTIIVIRRQMFAHTDISNDNHISDYYAQL